MIADLLPSDGAEGFDEGNAARFITMGHLKWRPYWEAFGCERCRRRGGRQRICQTAARFDDGGGLKPEEAREPGDIRFRNLAIIHRLLEHRVKFVSIGSGAPGLTVGSS
jgi:hypothetical protein